MRKKVPGVLFELKLLFEKEVTGAAATSTYSTFDN
jgi:hypothetical protein